MDDYEAGTFTPVVEGSSVAGSATYNVREGRYTKVGNLVTFQWYANWTGGTGSGTLYLKGLPFTTNNGNGAGSIGEIENITTPANTNIGLRITASNLALIRYTSESGGASSSLAYDGAGYIIASGFYYTDQ